MKLHHVGVAVADLEPAIEMYTSTFGAVLTHRASNEADGLIAAFLQVGDAEIELLAPLREDSTVGKFLARRGPGMHHVAYGVDDIAQALDDARAAGMELIDTQPRMGMHGTLIAFIHPKSVGGVLTEFVQI
ncbi:MAG TPA: methylmalonyl-CoA epimerase [Candidatus Dormibacteraeota bacterium]|nr:methylmalonyl-CoA epimerase [Candidatus Dormibacteraeota bacterium]